jgi:hypothetical protein
MLSVRTPAEVNVTEQAPADSAAEQEAPASSDTVTVPVGAPAPGASTDTEKGTETGWPTTDGLALGAPTATAVLALST